MAKYLVTGGCGFIGAQLVEQLLLASHDVIVVDDLSNGQRKHKAARYVKANAADYEQIAPYFKQINGCFHLAAKPSVSTALNEWFQFHESNLTSSLSVFKAAITEGCLPVVYASSCAVYGNQMKLPLAEDEHVQPISAYACDKLSTELNAFFLNHEYHLSSIGLRFFNVYGPYQPENSPYSGVITRFITQLLKNEPLTIYGDGLQTRDFIFVDDIVNHLIFAMNNLQSGAAVVNLCTQKSITINELINEIEGILGKKAHLIHTKPRAVDTKHSCGSNKKMREHGFTCQYDLRKGLEKTIEYFQEK